LTQPRDKYKNTKAKLIALSYFRKFLPLLNPEGAQINEYSSGIEGDMY
jgi:hypothetical protein